jgi:3-hydroxybutyryl-CoA dehydrogenase
MKIVVAASDEQWNELTGSRTSIDWQRISEGEAFNQHTNADAFFSLKNNNILPAFESLKKPVFINSVVQTLTDLAAPTNVYRINGWNTFLKRSTWEIAGTVTENVESVFKSLSIKTNTVKDEPGFISARIIAMIINEGYFALEDSVSSKAEIDTAMKLGTNYPFGPFEWAELIGLNNILALLQKLNSTDTRYQPSQLLIKEVKENNE